MTKMPEDLYGALTYLNIMSSVNRVVEGKGVDDTVWIYLDIPFIHKNTLETLVKVGSVIGIMPIEDEVVAIICSK